MEVVAPSGFSVASIASKTPLKREKVIRARLNAIEAHEWNRILQEVVFLRKATDEASVIRYLINNYAKIKQADEAISLLEQLREIEKKLISLSKS